MEALGELIGMISVNPEFKALTIALIFLAWVTKTVLDFALQKKYAADKELATAMHDMATRLDVMSGKIGDLTAKIRDCRFKE